MKTHIDRISSLMEKHSDSEVKGAIIKNNHVLSIKM
jgi:hypothetical protein